jgi:hypothetical protein
VIGVFALPVTVRVLHVLCVVCCGVAVRPPCRGGGSAWHELLHHGIRANGHRYACARHTVSQRIVLPLTSLSVETRPAADFPLSYPLHPHIRAPLVGAVSTASPFSHLHHPPHLTFGKIHATPTPPCILTGKTYTMLGDVQLTPAGVPSLEAGLIPRVVCDIFRAGSIVDDELGIELKRTGVVVSFLEVYNEQARISGGFALFPLLR